MTGPRRQNTPTTLRTFVALPLPTEIHQALKALQDRLKRHAVLRPAPTGVVRWVDPESIHLTLHFLGDILPERVEPIKTALTVVARNVQPFAFQTGTLGAFPNLNRPQVIWVGVQDPTSWLTLLHAAVNEALASLGFQPEQRHFSPHLTLDVSSATPAAPSCTPLEKLLRGPGGVRLEAPSQPTSSSSGACSSPPAPNTPHWERSSLALSCTVSGLVVHTSDLRVVGRSVRSV